MGGLMLSGGGGIDPSPTNDLNVSGIKLDVSFKPFTYRRETYKVRGTRMTPVAMAKNQNIDLQPSVSANTPPNNGPKAGPTILDPWKRAINIPLSPGSAISEIVPDPIDITAEPPVACTALRTSNNQ
jgi:hypothetical protein